MPPGAEEDVLAAMLDVRRAGRAAVLVTVVRTRGSTPRKSGAKMLVTRDAIVGTIGGGRVEQESLASARALLDEGAAAEPALRCFQLTRDLAMCCGGEMEVFMEPMQPSPRLFVCGGGHVGRALVPVAARLGFRVHVVDDLDEHQDPARYPDAAALIDDFDPARWPALSEEDYVVVVTRDHAIDQRVMEALLPRPRAYLGLIGSARKIALFKERTALRGLAPSAWDDVHAPIGLDIGAETPDEIAIAIAAELVSVRARRRR